MRKITKGIKEMARLGFALTGKSDEDLKRQFVKHDERGTITRVINYYYIEGIGASVFTNDIENGKGFRIDTALLNAIELNFYELKSQYKEEI